MTYSILNYPKETKARKTHQCSLCYEKINNKEVYIGSTYVFDGDVNTWRVHKRCNKLVDLLNMHDNCEDGVSGEDFQETISDFYYTTLINSFEESVRDKYSDILGELDKVRWRDKFWFTIRHFARLEKELNKQI